MRPQFRRSRIALLTATLLALFGCGESATLDVKDSSGPQPVLPAPHATLLPTAKIAKAVGWPAGARPTPAAGLAVQAFAKDLDHPRWLAVMTNGDVLVAETNAPPWPQDSAGFKGWVAGRLMTRAGAAPSDNIGASTFQNCFIASNLAKANVGRGCRPASGNRWVSSFAAAINGYS
ncbi:hypothetical protein [Dyella sp.]|uniref:hypothetical protein n=1 Tax=Dyella sp. TaxID=1869338 RepID=UPI003F7D6AF0